MNDIPTRVFFWEFFNPDRLWALMIVPVLLLAYIILLRLKRNRGMRYTQTGIVGAVLPRQSRWRRHISVLMTLCSLFAITGAWARPVGVEKVPRERATVVVVLDRSMSMQATDVQPSRFEASKTAAKSFIEQLPEQYNVAVVGLSATPSVLSAPTTDRIAISTVIDRMDMQPGTAVGDGIVAALSAVTLAPGADSDDPAPAIIVMLSDGQSTGGSVSTEEATQRAVDAKVPVYTIAFGTQNGYVDVDGVRENVAPDIATMEQIAAATGAEAKDASSADELNRVYETMQSEVGYEEVNKEVTARWALYAFGFAIIAATGAVSMAARWP